jgi:hypothetical protein
MIGMKMIETKNCSNNAYNRIPTPSVSNINLTKHNNNNKTNEYLSRTELPLNVIDYGYMPKRTLMVRIYTKLMKLILTIRCAREKKEEAEDNIIVFMTRDIIMA